MKRYDNIERSEIGERIDELRAEKNVTLKKLAKRLDITEASLSMKIRGKRPFTVDELFILSDIFKITLDELVRGVSTEHVNIHRETGLGKRAISALSWFNKTESSKKIKAPNLALSHQQVLDALARYVSFYPEQPGYFLSEKVLEDEKLVQCTMSQRVYKNVLGQNLIYMLDEIRSTQQYSNSYRAYEDFRPLAEDEQLAEPSEFEKEDDSDETTER